VSRLDASRPPATRTPERTTRSRHRPATLVGLRDGTTSLYLGNGGATIGAGAVVVVSAAAVVVTAGADVVVVSPRVVVVAASSKVVVVAVSDTQATNTTRAAARAVSLVVLPMGSDYASDSLPTPSRKV
jgi:hypothetical protein